MDEKPSARPPTDNPATVHKVELTISWLLRIGVFSSLLVVLFGTIITFVHHPNYLNEQTTTADLLAKTNDFPHSLHDAITGLAHFDGRSIVILGLLLLIATPVMRVAVSIVAFAIQHDRTFVIVTSVVLLLLLLSFLLGKAGG